MGLNSVTARLLRSDWLAESIQVNRIKNVKLYEERLDLYRKLTWDLKTHKHPVV